MLQWFLLCLVSDVRNSSLPSTRESGSYDVEWFAFPKQLSSSFPGHVFSLNHDCATFFVTVELVKWVNLKAWKQSTQWKIHMFSKQKDHFKMEIYLSSIIFRFHVKLGFEMHGSLLALTMLSWNGDRWPLTVEVSFWESRVHQFNQIFVQCICLFDIDCFFL